MGQGFFGIARKAATDHRKSTISLAEGFQRGTLLWFFRQFSQRSLPLHPSLLFPFLLLTVAMLDAFVGGASDGPRGRRTSGGSPGSIEWTCEGCEGGRF